MRSGLVSTIRTCTRIHGKRSIIIFINELTAKITLTNHWLAQLQLHYHAYTCSLLLCVYLPPKALLVLFYGLWYCKNKGEVCWNVHPQTEPNLTHCRLPCNQLFLLLIFFISLLFLLWHYRCCTIYCIMLSF